MIPKIIHYCWLSDDPFPPKIQRCVDSWKRILPDYEIRRWSMTEIWQELEADCRLMRDVDAMRAFGPWIQEAYEAKKYAFVADWVRLYALKKHGGVYLDSDVEVFKSFDDLLSLPYFLGFEKDGCPETAVMGAQKECPWIGKCLEYYGGRNFVLQNEHEMRKYSEKGEYISDFRYSIRPSPWIVREMLGQSFKIKPINHKEAFIADIKVVCVLPRHFFSFSERDCVREKQERYCVHHGVGAWKPLRVQRNLRIWAALEAVFGYRVTALTVRMLKYVVARGRGA